MACVRNVLFQLGPKGGNACMKTLSMLQYGEDTCSEIHDFVCLL
jgi:hypothetical protein